MHLTIIQETRIRNESNCADAMGVAPYVAAEIAMCVGNPLSDVTDSECDAAFQLWANQPIKP